MFQMNEREFDTRHFYQEKKFLFPRWGKMCSQDSVVSTFVT